MPKTHISRSIHISASPEEVFTLLSDFRKRPLWSQRVVREPEAKLTVSEDGSAYEWEGNLIGVTSADIIQRLQK